MVRKTIAFLCFMILVTASGYARFPVPTGSVRSPYINKFIVLRNLFGKLESQSKVVSESAKAAIVDVLFRNLKNIFVVEPNKPIGAGLMGLSISLNERAKRIQGGLKNFYGCLGVGSFKSKADREMLIALADIATEEMKDLIFDKEIDKSFFTIRSVWDESFAMVDNEMPKNENAKKTKEHNLDVLNRLKPLIELTEYIYQEQMTWVMAEVFRIESIKKQLEIYEKNGGMTIDTRFEVGFPPRIFYPGVDFSSFDLR